MSWFSNYLFGDYSDESVVPDSYEGTAISDSFEKPVSSNLRETEVVSGIRYRDNTVQLDLNTPVEDPYAQQVIRISVTVASIALYSRSVIQTTVTVVNKVIRISVTVASKALYSRSVIQTRVTVVNIKSIRISVTMVSRRMCLLTRKVVTRLHFRLIQRRPFRHVKSWCVGYKTQQKTMVTSL
ncbi:hypothetical protein HanRHA438_Chr13g0585651 [Helianthus annuus]|uniref:Uncharacterized protein n=1 Tax=Helianthus annuus TaxID=4232 RepID=A0A9K3EG40_HELAN|nr:hypothetical protein HanXRQr2_Chr13g0574781 [Helianthus annuus]KAJ0496697.1 hypothetical protein HanHA89_Chr13g0502761 [Helianthus annuus]KAJ0848111.1 hypothetical protein HanPSC8_Chr13g0553311 [Helianthus annuus]KAJ0857058.1 hypothetical protein HanRHA438_Chr13g0585651 [Helianthus annuus]